MTSLDREQFLAFTLRQARLVDAVTDLGVEFRDLKSRVELSPSSVESAREWATIPLLPPLIPQMPAANAIPSATEVQDSRSASADPTPAAEMFAPVPETQPASPFQPQEEEKQGGLEFQFGRWLARIGVVFALITLISFSTLAYKQFHHLMGPWSKLTILTLISSALVAAGLRIERKNPRLTVYGRTLAGGGLACLYYTLYGATYVGPLQVIGSPLLGGLLLLGWSAAVLFLAERKKSELLSIFAIALAYFSSAITPVGGFTMVANLILSITAVIFLVRNAWTGLSYLCLVGTYVGLLRQFVVYDRADDFWVELVRHVAFWPAAAYLAGAWVIYTAGVFLATTPQFAAGKRMAFLCLNNGALVGLITLTTYLSGFGHLGTILCLTGGLFIAASYLVRYTRAEAGELHEAYLMQGLALGTGGLVIAYSGVTRGLVITVESVFLAAAGAFARNRIMRIAAYASSLLGAGFLVDEISASAAHPWVLTIAGAGAMLANAWLARRDFWSETREVAGQRFCLPAAYYVLLATALAGIGIVESPLSQAWIPPVMALTALALTFSVYVVPLIELPLLIQILLVGALWGTVFPVHNVHSWPSDSIVGLVTLLLIAWWPRQKFIRTDHWLQPVLTVYALALVAVGTCMVHPHVDAQGWMVAASLLSLMFMAYGAGTRTWQFMVAAQVYLALAIGAFLNPPTHATSFPWTWWAAALPPATVFLTAWFTRRWLPRFWTMPSDVANSLNAAVHAYQALALALVVRWIFGIIPANEDTLSLFLLATVLLLWNMRWPSAFGLRAGLLISLVGAGNYIVSQIDSAPTGFTWNAAGACLLFLAQPALLRRWGRELVSGVESWAVILISSAMAWRFVSDSIAAASGPHNLTLGWALFALVLTLVGFAANERRQRWCGLGILLAAIVRGGVYDFWGFSDLYKVITFFALTVVCLGLSFLYYKFADRLREWL
jgi:hypothetical protein